MRSPACLQRWNACPRFAEPWASISSPFASSVACLRCLLSCISRHGPTAKRSLTSPPPAPAAGRALHRGVLRAHRARPLHPGQLQVCAAGPRCAEASAQVGPAGWEGILVRPWQGLQPVGDEPGQGCCCKLGAGTTELCAPGQATPAVSPPAPRSPAPPAAAPPSCPACWRRRIAFLWTCALRWTSTLAPSQKTAGTPRCPTGCARPRLAPAASALATRAAAAATVPC